MQARACATLLALAVSLIPGGSGAMPRSAPSLSQPSLSPDARQIAFASGGSIWTVPVRGGRARLLVSDGATDERPIFSPDGREIAYVSSRTGNGDVYVLKLADGSVRRITYDDGYDELDGWSSRGEWLYFSNSSHNIYGARDIYRVSSGGGTPLPVVSQPYMNVYLAAPSPRGDELAFNARGFAGSQWWRIGHSHLDECEIWLRQGLGERATYRRITPGQAKDEWPMWSPDGRTLYFMSDRSGAQNLWTQPPGGSAQALTHFGDGRVVWPSIARNGSSIVFQRDFGVWRYDVRARRAARVPITLEGAIEQPQISHVTLKDHFQTYSLAPDGKKIAFIVRGRLFAADAQTGGSAFRVPTGSDYATAVTWSPDSNSVAFVAGHGHEGTLRTYDFLHDRGRTITERPADIHALHYRPRSGGGSDEIAFEEGGRFIRIADAATKAVRTVATVTLPWTPDDPDLPLQWSPDGRWLAFFAAEPHGFTNVHLVHADASGERPISLLANVFTNTISWDPAGKFLLFDTTQRTEPAQIARVDLVPRTPTFEETRFKQLFTPSGAQPAPAAPPAVLQTNAAQRSKPSHNARVDVQFAGIRERLQFLPVGLDVNSQSISPDGKTVLLSATVAGQTNLYLFPLTSGSGEAVAHQLTHSTGEKNLPAWSPDGKRIYYLNGTGAIEFASVQDGKESPLAVSAEFDDDWNRDKVEAFTQAWSAVRDFYADPMTNGVNWQQVRTRYAPQIAGAQTPDEFRGLLRLMIGEIDSSHTNAYPPAPAKRTTGHLGLDFDRAQYERTGRLRITAIVPQSPAAVEGSLRPGDAVLAINGTPVTRSTNIDALLDNTAGKQTTLAIAPGAGGARRVALKPIDYASATTLRYRAWTQANRQYVARLSGGRLGYVHMEDMSAESLANLYKDLDVTDYDKTGVVVDVRSNEGGFVNAYAIDVFARRPYLRMYPRGRPEVSARVELGQRALERPTVLVVNEETLSDGEDFTQGYRQLGLGKVVGVPTAGWIIYTSAIRLVDGSTFRLPFERVTTLSGENMELHPRPVDVYATRPVGSHADPQLEAAVKALLQEIR